MTSVATSTSLPPLLILSTGPGEPAWNMALDEALLVTAAPRQSPLLRFYGWTGPAATFGYSQRLADIERQTLLRPLLRRPTGGGLVPHDCDWTYSFTVPPAHPWYELSALESYRSVHAWIVEALGTLGVSAELAQVARCVAPGQCFAGHERFDVLWGGRKIAGAAQRRNRLGLLIQGSLQPPPRLDRADWESAMTHTAPPAFFPSTAPAPATPPEAAALASELVAGKYAQAAYHARR
ncbi:MAG: hypothetical protein KF833_07875 [Verrucomicrobiae bacterium]|nr:hypothetical protein [Verrucomicrobiae bacterium]